MMITKTETSDIIKISKGETQKTKIKNSPEKIKSEFYRKITEKQGFKNKKNMVK